MRECLSALPDKTAGIISEITRHSPMRRRLLDLGFVPGTRVTPLFSGCCGGIRAYRIHGSVIALRDRDAACILVDL